MYTKKKKNVKKFRRKFNPRKIRSKQTYSVSEITNLLGIHPNTVRVWLRNGLEKIDNRMPWLIFGQDLKDFISERNKRRKFQCKAEEIFCFKCQKPRQPKGDFISIKIDRFRIKLAGICTVCGTKMSKSISPNKVDFYKNIFCVEVVHEEDLIECANTSVTVNKKQKG